MTYSEAVEYINASYITGKKHTLNQIREILNYLGNPQEAYRIIHVAGTNGKGSSCAMLSSILNTSGYKTGVFISPHILRINERISIDGAYIDDDTFADIAGVIYDCEKSMPDSSEGLSFFEILTLMSFVFFAREHVSYAVMETGIGGRLDVTNVPEHTFLSVITSIGYDHCEMLGNTLEEIAVEKAGIIKKKRPLVLYLTTQKVYNRIQVICSEQSARLYYFDKPFFVDNILYDLNKTTFSVSCDYFSYEGLELSLLGQYQVFNACHVLLSIYALRELGVTINDQAVRDGLLNTVWPGRMEVLNTDPLLLVDGAHNVDAAQAFCRSIETFRRGKKHVIIMGMLKSKDAIGFIKTVSQAADSFIITQPSGNKALEAQKLAELIDDNKLLAIEPDCRMAIDKALALAGSDTVISVVGSLYLIGDVKKYFAEVKNDRLQGGNSEV